HTYSWTPATGLSSSTISNPVASPTATTTYTLTETITATGCQKSNSVTITISVSPGCLISGNTSICQGQTTQLCAPAGCTTYLWSTGAKTSCITVSTAGTYSVTVSNAGGCMSSCSKTVSVIQPPVCTISGNNYCTKSQPTQLCAPAGCSSYSWSTGAKTSCIMVNVAGTYSCTVSNSNGCTSNGSKSVTINSQSAIIVETPTDSVDQKTSTVENEDSVDATPMRLEVFPNPTENFFTLIIHSDSRLDAEVRVFDVLGHAVSHLHGTSGEQIRFGSQLVQGMYFVEVLQGNKRKVVKVIKI
ncbi:MAG TPA: T9SS type A sorting domain-containing protein, partial [Puia sp.]|nr:T9SS type A sorting domain-containing protein [Puia sp.]